MNQKVVILDAGAQYGKVIDRRVRELQVESVILPMATPARELTEYQAIIISGGPESVYDDNAPSYDPALLDLHIPILGICYGMQLMVHALGGVVEKKAIREDGPSTITIQPSSALFAGMEPLQKVLLTHGDTVDQVAPGFTVTATSEDGLIAGIEHLDKKMYGVQFHPEVDLTQEGQTIFKHFLYDIAGFKGDFTLSDRMETAIAYIQQTVGDKQVLVLVSGGVDSTVTAALLAKALPAERIFALHVDSGFMRHQESHKVEQALAQLGLNLRVVDASQTFYQATTMIDGRQTLPLNQTTNPEEKRKIIGDTFIKVAEQAVADWQLNPDQVVLAQGTLRPDLIESASQLASGKAHTIKTHHNDTGLVRQLRAAGKVIEPLQDYHKDEVRELGKKLGLSDELVWRQPFPGPGLAIRILCAEEPYVTPDYQTVQDQLDELVINSDSGLSAHLLPVRTVGVQGDGRTFSYLCGLSGTADWPKLHQLARQIPKRVHQVNRVVYVWGDAITQPPTQITPTTLTPEVIEQLRQADEIVNQVLLKYDLIRVLSQVPVISFPVTFGQSGQRAIGIRTFITNDFMTGVPALPGQEIQEDIIREMVERVLAEVSGISRVVYDLTSKPPGTTEWE
jgi:GMP synthase (glutamine-hydrolysing)